jgi:hypothetical protein
LLACLALVGCNGGTVDRHALEKDTEAINSLACEGALLAGEVAGGDSTRFFARGHAANLTRRASNFEDALSRRPPVPGIERQVRALARKAGLVADLLEGLHRRPTDRDEATRLQRELAKAGDCP